MKTKNETEILTCRLLNSQLSVFSMTLEIFERLAAAVTEVKRLAGQ